MSDDELIALTDAEMRLAIGSWGGKLAEARRKAEYYYLGLPKGDLSPPEVDGRSSVVSTDVRNTVEAMLPQLMVKFTGGDTVVEFEPSQRDDEEKAQLCTDYLNYLFFKKTNGHAVTYTWFKDALIQKNGIIKVWWDTRDEETREEYKALSDVELAQILDDKEVEATEHSEYPDEEDAEQRAEAVKQIEQQLSQLSQQAQQNAQTQRNPQAAQQMAQQTQQLQGQIQQINATPPVMLHDITCKRVKSGGKITVDNVPPEEFLISRKAKDIANAPFVGHRVVRTMSELKSMGYKNLDNIGSDDTASVFNAERIERLGYDDEMAYLAVDTTTNDESQRQVWVTEIYMRVDFDGDGIAELRKVVRAGNQLLANDVVDIVPFVSICPVPMPHKFFGLSIADLAMPSQLAKTGLRRALQDNLNLQVNGRYFAVEGQVNLDDLLTSRPGGVVRIKQTGAVGRLDQASGDVSSGMEMLQYMEAELESSTGWTRYSAGNEANALQGTATGMNIVTNKDDMRLDLIARHFGEGFEQLFKLMLKLVCQHQDKAAETRINGKWVNIDPREWRNQFDTSINIGLGVGNKDQKIGHLMALLQHQAQVFPLGVANPKNVYEGSVELAKLQGFKSGDKFFHDPGDNPPPPAPNPDAIKAQSAMQLAQMKQQDDAHRFQAEQQMKTQTDEAQRNHEAQLEQLRMRMQAEVDQARDQSQAAQKTLEMQQEAQLAQLHAQYDAEQNGEKLALDKYKADLDAQTKLAIAGMSAAPQIDVTPMQTTLDELIAHMNAPSEILRDASGRAMGVKKGNVTRNIVRDAAGRAQGVA